ncbi:MAG: dienelactone hydrolase family protein [Desulfobacterales bacterium]|jgi:predicted alpha/beta-hydrolase family hydrolase
MPKYSVRIPIERQRFVEGRLDIPDNDAGAKHSAVIMAHGAANDMHEPLLQHLAQGLCRAGFLSMRFNFPYRTEGRQRPDAQRVLESAWLDTVGWLRKQNKFPLDRVVVGGKSMGARVASQLAGAGKLEADGYAFWGYPLHPPGRKNQLRDAHLDGIRQSILFVSGTRDTFCDMSLLQGVVARLGRRATLEIVENGDHSFRLPKSSDTPQLTVYDHILSRTLNWLNQP